MHLALPDEEVHAVVGAHSGEHLRDPAELNGDRLPEVIALRPRPVGADGRGQTTAPVRPSLSRETGAIVTPRR